MNYPSIRIEGAILSPDILDRLDELPGQRPSDFGLESGAKVKDEIARAWADAQDYWRIFQRKLDSLRQDSLATTETRQQWMIPLLGLLGYQLEYQHKGAVINEKIYAFSHRVANRAKTPVHIVGYNDPAGLDRKPDRASGPRMSAHALVQEFLNLADELYAVATNGRVLRLLRDSSRLVKLTYLEFDLDRIFTDGLFADFALLYRLLHSSRLPASIEESADSLIEKYHQDSLDSGARIREGLSEAVERTIVSFANGLLSHPKNAQLVTKIASGEVDATAFYQNLLRLIYRILFLLVIEERHLVYPLSPDNGKQRVYYQYYSLQRLRRLSERRYLADPRHEDLWHALIACFRLFEADGTGHKLGIAPLGGDLFNPKAIQHIRDCYLDNETVLGCLRALNLYRNPDTRQLIRVNYAALNVEEFGSVYEGLLEFDPTFIQQGQKWEFAFEKGDERSNTGSHYTPDDLVQPLLKHSVDYQIADKLKEKDQEAALLSLRVADIACGSGHILLAAARRIGTELAIVRTGEEQPSPSALRQAIRDVIRNCIYGVDLNPLAVELCKVALWLEAHVPGQPLNFLDHHIKCGNAIVGFVSQEEMEKGVPDEAFKTLPDDDKAVASTYRKKNKEQRADSRQFKFNMSAGIQEQLTKVRTEWQAISAMPEETPEQIEKKKAKYIAFSNGEGAALLRKLASAPIAQFYIPKTQENKTSLITDKEYRDYLSGLLDPQAKAMQAVEAIAERKRIFHWFIEFPEIAQRGGFDCILGNPPFLGNRKISGKYGDGFKEYISWEYSPAGVVELVTYFFRRAFSLLKESGFTGLIATNTIAQGFSREGGLAYIEHQGAEIVFANPSLKWPGNAVLEVALVSLTKGAFSGKRFIRLSPVVGINSYLKDISIVSGEPKVLQSNQSKSFIGSVIAGSGFILDPEEAALLQKDHLNVSFVKPYLTGQDLFSSPGTSASRFIIDLGNLSLEEAEELDDLIGIVRERVKPKRDTLKREAYRKRWWQFAERCESLYRTISGFSRVLVTARISKTHAFAFVHNDQVFADALVVFAFEGWSYFSVLQSSIHEMWAWAYCTTMKTDKNYSPTRVFQTFPFPTEEQLNSKDFGCGKKYYEHRIQLQELISAGLTTTYNLFHSTVISPETVAKVSKKSDDEAEKGYRGILKLRELHCELDQAVLSAYGWTDLDLGHDFHEVDYLPDNDRIRYTISPEARKEVLQRLLKLNHERHAEENSNVISK